MLWSLIIAPGSKHRLVEIRSRILHISKATLDLSSTDENISLLMVMNSRPDRPKDGAVKRIILCNLNKEINQESVIDLNCDGGIEVVEIYSNGPATVHLTGYYFRGV